MVITPRISDPENSDSGIRYSSKGNMAEPEPERSRSRLWSTQGFCSPFSRHSIPFLETSTPKEGKGGRNAANNGAEWFKFFWAVGRIHGGGCMPLDSNSISWDPRGQAPDILFLKQNSRIIRQSSNRVCGSWKSQASSLWAKQHRA